MKTRNRWLLGTGMLLVAGAIFAAVMMHRGPHVQVLDDKGGDVHELTLRVMRPFPIDECSLRYTGTHDVSYRPADDVRLNLPVHLENVSSRYHRIDSPLSPVFTSIADFDGDGKRDSVAVCHRQCPAAYDGTHLAFNLTMWGLAYAPLHGPDDMVDLSEGGEAIETSFAPADGAELWVTVRGTTASMPYTLNLHDEIVRIYTQPYHIPDLDGDGETELLFADRSYHIKLGSGEVMTIPREGGVTTLRDDDGVIGELVVEDGEVTVIPKGTGTGTFRYEHMVGSGAVGDIMRLYVSLLDEKGGNMRLLCPAFEEVIWRGG